MGSSNSKELKMSYEYGAKSLSNTNTHRSLAVHNVMLFLDSCTINVGSLQLFSDKVSSSAVASSNRDGTHQLLKISEKSV